MSDGVVACVVTIGVVLALLGLAWLDLRARRRRRRKFWGTAATVWLLSASWFRRRRDVRADMLCDRTGRWCGPSIAHVVDTPLRGGHCGEVIYRLCFPSTPTPGGENDLLADPPAFRTGYMSMLLPVETGEGEVRHILRESVIRTLGRLIPWANSCRPRPGSGSPSHLRNARTDTASARNHVLVGHVACLGRGGGGHTSWHCRTWDAVTYGPPPAKHCTALEGPAAVRISNVT